MATIKLSELLAIESEQLQKLNLIIHRAVEEEKLLTDKLLEFEDPHPPFVSRLADKVAGFVIGDICMKFFATDLTENTSAVRNACKK